MIGGVGLTILLVAIVWKFLWYGSFAVLAAYAIYCIYLLRLAAAELDAYPSTSSDGERTRPVMKLSPLPKISKDDLNRAALLHSVGVSTRLKHRSRVLRRALENDRLKPE